MTKFRGLYMTTSPLVLDCMQHSAKSQIPPLPRTLNCAPGHAPRVLIERKDDTRGNRSQPGTLGVLDLGCAGFRELSFHEVG